MKKLQKGYVQIYTGDGKGKTTAALGLAMRAIGDGYKVMMVQFLKGGNTGELKSTEFFGENFVIKRFEKKRDFFWNLKEKEKKELKKEVQEGLDFCFSILREDSYDILIMDEVMGALNNKLIEEEQLVNLIAEKPINMEMVLTGRNVPKSIFDKADLITEMKAIKHYFNDGVLAREGIEY